MGREKRTASRTRLFRVVAPQHLPVDGGIRSAVVCQPGSDRERGRIFDCRPRDLSSKGDQAKRLVRASPSSAASFATAAGRAHLSTISPPDRRQVATARLPVRCRLNPGATPIFPAAARSRSQVPASRSTPFRKRSALLVRSGVPGVTTGSSGEIGGEAST